MRSSKTSAGLPSVSTVGRGPSHGKVDVGTLSSRRSEKNPRGATQIGAFSPEVSWKGSGARIVRACFLGGVLADLCAEHYSWLATGDKSNPDAATVEARAAAFLSRLDTLFMEGTILGMPDTFTGVTLRFLRGTSRYRCGASVQIVGLGDLKTETVRDAVKAALRRVQTIVANAKENMKLYRPEHSWLHAFIAFRLPSPLSATDAGATEAATEAEACLRRICQDASLSKQKAIAQLRQVLKRAEWHQRDGCTTRQAWGRAAAEWPELNIGRRLVELFLVWKTSSGNLERRFRRFAELHCPERARLLDTSVEECSMVDQAPPQQAASHVAGTADAGTACGSGGALYRQPLVQGSSPAT